MGPEDYDFQKLIDRIKSGTDDLKVDDLVPTSKQMRNRAIDSSRLSEGALASQYLKDTGVSVPNIKTASRSEVESFLNKIKEEAYPELSKSAISVKNDMPDYGSYNFNTKNVDVSKLTNPTKESLVGTAFHELGHAYDDSKGLVDSVPMDKITSGKKELLHALDKQGGRGYSKVDASVIEEIMNAGHHAKIPNLREGTYGMGALKSLLKSKTFKSAVPFIGPAIAGGVTMLDSGDASAATQAALPIVSEADSVGPEAGSLEADVEDPTKSYEQRRKAIETLSNRNK